MEEFGIATLANPIAGLSLTFQFAPHSQSVPILFEWSNVHSTSA